MKTTKVHNLFRCIIFLAALLFTLLILQSCSRKISFQTSPVVPAAKGKVKVKKDKNNNYGIQLNLMRLAEPERLTPPKSVYVVWMVTEYNGTKNIGQLKTSTGFLSKKLKSSLETVTPFQPTEFSITAEDNGDIQFPRGQVILRTGSF